MTLDDLNNAIGRAVSSEIERTFLVYFEALALMHDHTAEAEKAAEDHFRKGLALISKAQETALSMAKEIGQANLNLLQESIKKAS